METFEMKTKIVFGEDALGALAGLRARRVVIVTDRFFSESGEAARVGGRFSGAEVRIFDAVTPDPSVELAAEGAKLLRDFQPDVLCALGGGSPIDCAKAMKALYDAPLHLIAIPTTSGTGSEVTAFSILTRGETKCPLVDDALIPELAVLDGSFLEKLPKGLIADAGMDVLSHCLEAAAARGHSPFTDALAQYAFTQAFESLPRSFQGDVTAREPLHIAACMAGVAFNQAGLGVCHALSHALGARFHVAHGRLNAILLPGVIRYNAQAAPGCYAALATRIGLGAATEKLSVRNLIRALEQLRRQLNLPGSLAEAGISLRHSLNDVVSDAMHDVCLAGNPRKPSPADLRSLLQEAEGHA